MKILCVIDSLGSGGAQRQMVNLPLVWQRHHVELFIYHQGQLLSFNHQSGSQPSTELTHVSGFHLGLFFLWLDYFEKEDLMFD